MDDLLFGLKVVTALGCGLIAGTFFAFSVFIMRALAALPAPGGIAAMQSINVAVLNPVFLGVFVGSAALCVAAAIGSLIRWQGAGSVWVLAGAILYLAGCFAVTMFFNVPLNDALAKADPAAGASVELWNGYVNTWTMWNHVRTLASLGASAAFIVAVRY